MRIEDRIDRAEDTARRPPGTPLGGYCRCPREVSVRIRFPLPGDDDEDDDRGPRICDDCGLEIETVRITWPEGY